MRGEPRRGIPCRAGGNPHRTPNRNPNQGNHPRKKESQSLIPWINRHRGETAWLFGKGPSLAEFDFKTAGPLRAAINDTIAHIPDCIYAFKNDGVRDCGSVFRPQHTLFHARRCQWEYKGRPVGVACQVVWFDDGYDDTRLLLPREELARSLTIRRNTVGSAIQILHIMGVETVHMVGFDGGSQYAPGFEWIYQPIPQGSREYDAARDEAIDAAFLMGITVKINGHTMTPSGKQFVRILRNTETDGIRYYTGQIITLAPELAARLIAEGRAESFTPPQKTKPETAAIR